jgi:RNA polymerase sigma-70 factor (ECF subfamily)
MLSDAAIKAFCSRRGEEAQTEPELPDELSRLWEAVRHAWPTVAIEETRFFAFLGERAGERPLASLHATDLYLACACIDGDAAALRGFEALLDEVGRKVRRLAVDQDALAEAKQKLRHHVLLPRGERPPALADYNGQGELGGWLRIALGRQILRSTPQQKREVRLDTGETALVAGADDDPETAFLKAHYQREFKDAFAAALDALADEDRRALHYAVVERLSIDEIALLEGTHRATAARRVERARERLAERTREALYARLALAPAQLQSVLRLISSQIDVSVRRLLGDGSPPAVRDGGDS